MLTRPTGVLLCEPTHFAVTEARNPYARDGSGALQRVDPVAARAQWEGLRDALREVGLRVQVMSATPGLPDQVFVANPAFTGPTRTGPAFVAGRMRWPEREDEVSHASAWLRAHDHRRILWTAVGPMEGSGDLRWGPGLIFAGHGVRSTEPAARQAASCFGVEVMPIRLVDERWYHLDTALCVLDAETALWVPEAFDETGAAALEAVFPSLHAVPEAERGLLAANGWCPDARHLLVDAACTETAALARDLGFDAVGVDTSEFRKAGGSVTCMTQPLWD